MLDDFLPPFSDPNRVSTPPPAAEALLALLLEGAERDPILGDFEQEFRSRHKRYGRRPAQAWYWRQALASLPALCRLFLMENFERSNLMDKLSLNQTDNRRAIIGFILLLPAFLLLSGGILYSMGQPALNDLYDRYNLLDTLMHPAVILAGMAAAAYPTAE